jgi:hypothetical protein
MAIAIIGSSGAIADVDSDTRALRVTPRAANYGALGMYRFTTGTQAMTAALVGNAEIFQFRWSDSNNLALVHRVSISAGAIAAAGAAALVGFNLYIARNWTGVGSGGSRFSFAGNTNKLRVDMGSSLVNDAGVSTTGALIAGTKTFDAQPIGSVRMGIGTGAVTTHMQKNLLPHTALFNSEGEGYTPIILSQNEGFVVRNHNVNWPTLMTWQAVVNVLWAEAASF